MPACPWLLLIDTDARVAEFFGRNASRTFELVRTRGGDDALSLDEAVAGFEVSLASLWFGPERMATSRERSRRFTSDEPLRQPPIYRIPMRNCR